MKKLLAVMLFMATLLINSGTTAAKTLSYVPENPEMALVIIHGYGQDGARLQWLTDKLKGELPTTAFYYPDAPDYSPVGGRQWFVIPAFGAEMADLKLYGRMLSDAVENVVVLHELIDEIHNDLKIPYENIDVAGFSQGGLMAVLAALTNPNHIGRAVSLSGVPLVLTDNFDKEMAVASPDILLIQGTNDGVIPADSLKMTKNTLETLGLSPQAAVIPGMRHEINAEALRNLVEFLQ